MLMKISLRGILPIVIVFVGAENMFSLVSVPIVCFPYDSDTDITFIGRGSSVDSHHPPRQRAYIDWFEPFGDIQFPQGLHIQYHPGHDRLFCGWGHSAILHIRDRRSRCPLVSYTHTLSSCVGDRPSTIGCKFIFLFYVLVSIAYVINNQLNDLIRQDASKPVSPTQVQSTRAKTLKPKKLSTKVENLLRGRAATNGSLLLVRKRPCMG